MRLLKNERGLIRFLFRLIERSYLLFCFVLFIKTGSDSAETYKKMLAELNMMTEFKAEGVMAKRPTLRSLFEGYEAEPDPGRRGRMLSDCIVSLLFMAYGILFIILTVFSFHRSLITRTAPPRGRS